MGVTVEDRLRTLLRTIFGLSPPGADERHLPVRRPEGLKGPDPEWLEGLVDATTADVLLSFELREKLDSDDAAEIEAWQQVGDIDEWSERRKNHRLRIRTAVDNLFEHRPTHSEVPSILRAWKIQVADACADGILDRFYLRPASTGPRVAYRRTMYEIGQDLQHALGSQALFLMSGRVDEVRSMELAIERAYRAIRRLVQEIEDDGMG